MWLLTNIRLGLSYRQNKHQRRIIPLVSLLGGDVGNRTRVRKIQPANIYERSQLFEFRQQVHNRPRLPTNYPLGPESPSFARVATSIVRHSTFVSPGTVPGEDTETGGRGPAFRRAKLPYTRLCSERKSSVSVSAVGTCGLR
jgi:hypothetical protein